MKIAFFDTKPYDKPSFDKFGAEQGISFKYFETKLNEDTAELANGFDGVCVFVNDTVNAAVIDKLCEMGVRIVALRCAGFNNVDMKYAFGRIHVLRVPAYSPYAVAEHAIALLLTSIRRIHKAFIRTRDYNFSLAGMTGFEVVKENEDVTLHLNLRASQEDYVQPGLVMSLAPQALQDAPWELTRGVLFTRAEGRLYPVLSMCKDITFNG